MSTSSRLSRRHLVAGTAAGLAVAGVQPSRAHETHPAALAPGAAYQAANIPTPRNQTLVISEVQVQVFDSFNPFTPTGESYLYGVNQVCRESLFYVNFEQNEIIPWLATGYEYNDDYTELTFTLNPEARWSDGEPFTSGDIAFTLGLLRENANLSGSDPVRASVGEVTTPDDQTVVIGLTESQPRFHYNFMVGLVQEAIKTVPRHIWEPEDVGTFANNPPIYTGAYVLDQALPDQFMQIWRKRDDYWNSANYDPAPQFVIFRQLLPPDAEAQEFSSGALDVPQLPYLNQQALRGTFDNWIEYSFVDPCPRGVAMNQDSPSGLFATPEGRWAISHLIDRDTIASTIWQPPTQASQYPWASWASLDRWENAEIQAQYPLTFDLARAAELLDGLGATLNGDRRQLNGQDLNLRLITPVPVGDPEFQIAENLALNAAEVGIQIEVQAVPGSPFIDAWLLGEYDLTSHWMCGVALDPNQLYTKYLERQYKPVGEATTFDNNETRTQAPELNEIALELETLSPDDEANQALFDQGLEAFMATLPAAPTVDTVYPFAFSQEYWTGWPTNEDRYAIAASWWAQFRFVIGRLEATGKE